MARLGNFESSSSRFKLLKESVLFQNFQTTLAHESPWPGTERNFRGTFPIFLPRCFLLMIRTYRRVSTAFNQWLFDCLPRQREDYVILTDFVVPSISSTDTLSPPNVCRFQRNRIFPLRHTIFRSSRIDRYFSTRRALNQFWKLMLRSQRHQTI